MTQDIYDITFSPFRAFTRDEWRILEEHPNFPVSDIDLQQLQAMNEPLTQEEVADIYIPMVRLLEIHIAHYRRLHNERDEFFKRNSKPMPYIIGIAGSVAAGKSTTARVLQKLLSMSLQHPKVALVTTDGFLYSNKELEKRGIMNRKGFPESYDAKKLIAFLSGAKSGKEILEIPVYSHLYYDVMPEETQTIEIPDIIIVEGINVLQVSSKPLRRKVFVSDFFDFSIYVDAAEKDLKEWYLDRFLMLQKTAFSNPKSYFHKYSDIPIERLMEFGEKIWDEINSPNLKENILPTRFRADLIIEKSSEHVTRGIRMRKI